MAGYRPSKRRHSVDSDVDLPLIPVMSLLVVLVPMLLQTAVFEQIAAVQLNLPSTDEVTYQQEPPQQSKANESVTLAVTTEGFRFISAEDTIKTVKLTPEGAFDFEALDQAMAQVKKRFASQEAIILLIENEVLYDDIIHAMDSARPHFPGVSIADYLAAQGEEEEN